MQRFAFGGTEGGANLGLVGAVLYSKLDADARLSAQQRWDSAARIARIAQFANGDWWLATQAWSGKETILSAYITKSLADIPATPAKSLAQPGPGFWSAAKSPMTAVVGKSRGYLVTPEVELHAYDSATATWEAPRLKKNAPLIRANNDGTVLFSVRPALLSTNGGSTWGALKPGGALHGLAFFDAAHGLGLFATDAMSWSGSQELRRTTDGGKTWVRMQELEKSPCYTPSLRQNDVTQRLICVFRDENIHSAGMSGDWVAERVMH